MKKSALLFVLMLMASLGPVAAQQFQFPITVSDGAHSQDLTLGIDPNGTDGFDVGVDQLAPPPPFPGAFDARYRIDAEDYLKDIRFNDLTQKIFTMLYQEDEGQGPIVLTWDRSLLPVLWTFEIVDNVTGSLFGPLDMTAVNTLDVSTAGGLLDAGLRILVTPVAQATRYVATTGSDVGNDCTDPESPCATVSHAVDEANYGDIIDMAAGTYIEPGLVVEKKLIVQGQGVVVQ